MATHPTPLLPAHEDVVVVNGFVEFRDHEQEARKGWQKGRSCTAPAGSLHTDSDSEEEKETQSQSGLKDILACCYEEEEEDDASEDGEGMDKVPSLKPTQKSKQPSLRRMDTPDMWEQQQEALKQAYRRDVLQTTTEPVLHQTDTQDLWEQQMLLQHGSQPVFASPVPFGAIPHGVTFAAGPMMCLPPVPGAFPVAMPTPYPVVSQIPNTHPVSRPGGGVASTALGPGALKCEVSHGLELIQWCVDGSKFRSNTEKVLSPEFTLKMGPEPQQFRLMIQARHTGGRNGESFKKADGRGRISVRCLSSPPPDTPKVTLRVTVGEMAEARSEVAISHDFSDKSCCDFQTGDENDWDLKNAMVSNRVQIFLQVVEYA